MREKVAQLLPYFSVSDAPETAATPEDALDVFSATQRVDSAYERFRNLLDPGDEDILRRKAITRFLGRHLLEMKDQDKLAAQLLKGLVRGRYIPTMTHKKYADPLGRILLKGKRLAELIAEKDRSELYKILAVEIDRTIYRREAEDAMAYFFYEDIRGRIEWLDQNLSPEERETQLFLACHRALSGTDMSELGWHLYRTAESEWEDIPTENAYKEIAGRFGETMALIEKTIKNPATLVLMKRLQRLSVPYRILRDIMKRKDAADIVGDSAKLKEAIKDALDARMHKIDRQMLSRVWHSAAFLFLSKGVLALLTEVPYEMLLGGVKYVPLLVNLFFPPVLLFIMAFSIKRPGKENLAQITDVVVGICTGKREEKPLPLHTVKKGVFSNPFYGLFYIAVFALILVLIVRGLIYFDFSAVGGFYFIIFLGLVSFFGVRIRSVMNDVRFIVQKQRGLGTLLDFVALPIIDMGKQTALRASQINIFLFILDAIIEAPFKVLIGIVEEWLSYMRERKEDII